MSRHQMFPPLHNGKHRPPYFHCPVVIFCPHAAQYQMAATVHPDGAAPQDAVAHLLRHGCSLDGNHQTPLLDKVSNLCGNSIPCQIDLRCFGKIVALPKFKVHIMPDKTHGMVIHEQICINLLVTVLAKGAALGKVGMLIEIFQNSRIVGTAGGFFRQQA